MDFKISIANIVRCKEKDQHIYRVISHPWKSFTQHFHVDVEIHIQANWSVIGKKKQSQNVRTYRKLHLVTTRL
jgi:hypothetical protein